MPTYEYRCNACGHEFEQFQSITADPIKVCPKCGKKNKKSMAWLQTQNQLTCVCGAILPLGEKHGPALEKAGKLLGQFPGKRRILK